jgi:maltooligosyltrehalose trehalohydrolase
VTQRVHDMPFGTRLLPGGGACFRLWAPGAGCVELLWRASAALEEQSEAMPSRGHGWFELQLADARPGLRYAFRIDGGLVVPDPASRSNPDDVHRASQLVDPAAFRWPDAGWRGRPWHEAVIYELHVGCFTPEGTFRAAIGRLDDLVALGVTAIELMPVADFPGRRGWGYDGVLLFAPESGYGSPDALKQLVAAAHARGLMVLLDVVYNHFGPDGNYLHAYAAEAFFDPSVHTPWGAAIAFDGPQRATVRDFFIHNALYWIEEFHLDGLRIDAVHAMHDPLVPHFVDELAQRVRRLVGDVRPVHLILENHANDAARLARGAGGLPLLADAQWNDDLHHAMHVLLTGEGDGYYVDYADVPLRHLGRALAEGFSYQGEASAYAGGARRGTPSTQLPPLAFVNALQTHDQVGNRAQGERIGTLAMQAERGDALRALVSCLLLSPSPPMLFMGEEWAAGTPFLYFCDFEGELARAVTEGRRNEFSGFARFADARARAAIPDPNAETSFRRSQLNWQERRRAPHAAWLALYTQLLRLRQAELVPHLAAAGPGVWAEPVPGTLQLRWPLGGGLHWHLLAQLCDQAGPAALAQQLPGRVICRSHEADAGLPPWSVIVAREPA